jgi:hypothetical protein
VFTELKILTQLQEEERKIVKLGFDKFKLSTKGGKLEIIKLGTMKRFSW